MHYDMRLVEHPMVVFFLRNRLSAPAMAGINLNRPSPVKNSRLNSTSDLLFGLVSRLPKLAVCFLLPPIFLL